MDHRAGDLGGQHPLGRRGAPRGHRLSRRRAQEYQRRVVPQLVGAGEQRLVDQRLQHRVTGRRLRAGGDQVPQQ